MIRVATTAMVVALILAPTTTAHAQQQPLETLPPPTTPPQTTPPPTTDPPNSDFGVPDTKPPPPPPPADTVPVQKTDQDLAKEFRPSLKGSVGYQYQQVHGIPINAGRLRLGVGGQSDTQAHQAVLSIMYGSTTNGLRAIDVRVGWNGDLYRLGIVRLGVDVETGYLAMRRVTIDRYLWALGFGAGVHASVDVYSFGYRNDHAIFVEGKFDAHLHFGGAFVWGPSILAGFRY